jgi:hypothetical protein
LSTKADDLAAKVGLSKEELERTLAETLDHTIYLSKNAFKHVTLSSPQRFCTAPLLIKAMHKTHALNVLVRERLIEEAETILRILIEISFIVSAIAKDPSFVRQYARAAVVQKKRELQNWIAGNRTLPIPILSPDQVQQLEQQIRKFEEQIKKHQVKTISIKEYAEKAGQLGIYFINYSRLSSSVHSGALDLERFMKKDPDRKLLSIGPPDPGRPDVLLWVGIETMVRLMDSASAIFGLCVVGLDKVRSFYQGMSALMMEEVKII